MLPIYKVRWKYEDDPGMGSNPVISWSLNNWIAFSIRPNSHVHQHQRITTHPHPHLVNTHTVYITNPNQPNEVWSVYTQHTGIIEHIEWNNSNNCFLTVDKFATAKIWQQDNFLMNQWKCMATLDLGEGDQVRKVFWVSGCRKYDFNAEKMYSSKEIVEKFMPSTNNVVVSDCSDKKDAILVITSGGVFKMLMVEDFVVTNVVEKSLGTLKINVLKADVSFSNSKIFVGAQTSPTTVELFSITIKQNEKRLYDVSVEVRPCLVPNVTQDVDFTTFEITQLRCCSVNNSDQVVVCTRGQTSCAVQIYELRKEQVVLHPQFPRGQVQNTPQDTCVCLTTIKLEHNITSMFVSNLRFVNLDKTSNLTVGPKLTLVDEMGHFYVYALDTFSQVSKSLALGLDKETIRHGVFSPCDTTMLTLTDKGNIYLFLTPQMTVQFFPPQIAAKTEQSKLQDAVNLLYYSLVENCSTWDIFIYLSSLEFPLVEQTYKIFCDEFCKFNQSMQNMFFKYFMTTKAMFYHLFKDYCGVVETYFAMLVQGIFFYISSYFLTEKDAIFIDMILKTCQSSKEVDVGKVAQLIDSKDISMFLSNDLAFRPLIQWVTDYAVHIVRLILSSNHSGQNWKFCMKYFDQTTILYLRQLLLIFYIIYINTSSITNTTSNTTGNVRPNHQFYPIFVTMATPIDITSQLFKLVSKLQQILSGDTAVDATMNDLPFNNLPLMYLEMPSHDPGTGVLSFIKLSPTRQQFDEFTFQLSTKWEDVHQTCLSSPLSVGVAPISTKLRQIFDGVNLTQTSLMQGELVKQCSRCNCLTLYQAHSTRTFNTSWKSCWDELCYCGGSWKKVMWHV